MGLFSKKYKKEKNKSLASSFYHAYEGIKYCFIEERNMHIHCLFALLVFVGGIFFNISYTEWLVCFLCIALVISLEIINTSIENTVNMITTKENETAKIVKDTAAGAVFFASLVSFCIGIIIFLPRVLDFFFSLFM